MISLLAYIGIGLTGIVVLPWFSSSPYLVPRATFLIIYSFILLVAWLCFNPVINGFALLFLPMLAWWVLRSAMSEMPTKSLHVVLTFLAPFFLGMMLANHEHRIAGLAIIAAFGTVNSIYGIMQSFFKVSLFKKLEEVLPFQALGFTRAPNWVGTWTACTCIIAMYLATLNPLWYASVFIQVVTIYRIHCRGAYLAFFAGMITLSILINPVYIGPIVFIVLMSRFDKYIFKWEMKEFRYRHLTEASAFTERLNFWRVWLEQIRKTPIFGLGFHMISLLVPYLQRDINVRSKGKFLDPKNYVNPVPTRAHNDLLQHLADVGIFGLALLVVPTAFLLLNYPAPESTWIPFAMAGLVTILVDGIFFHTLYWPPTNCLFWVFLSSLIGTQTYSFQPGSIHALMVIVAGYLAWEVVIKEQIFDTVKWILWFKAQDHKFYSDAPPDNKERLTGSNELPEGANPHNGTRLRNLALKLRPDNSLMLYHNAINIHFQLHEFDKTIANLHRSIDRYDGETCIWAIYSNLANAYFFAGSPVLCLKFHEKALTFLPYWQHSQIGVQFAMEQLAKAQQSIERMRN